MKTEAQYEGDYQCGSGEPDEPCRKEATQVWREPYTPGRFRILLCNEHVQDVKAMGYHYDQEATVQLARDREREAERTGVLRLLSRLRKRGKR